MAYDEQQPIPLEPLPPLHETEAQPSAAYFPMPSRTLTFADEKDDADDIYRGEPPQPPSPPQTPRPESVSSSSSSTSSSSSSSSVFGGRLGAISGIVERAISHWARAWTSESSLTDTSSTSSMSQPSIITMSRSHLARRRRRRASVTDVHIARSEWEVQARIRARAEARQVPREFILYTPQTPESPEGRSKVRSERDQSGMLRTTSLPEIIGELSLALRDNQRIRRAQNAVKDKAPSPDGIHPRTGTAVPQLYVHDYMVPAQGPSVPRTHLADNSHERPRGRKGKHRATPSSRVPAPVKITKVPSDSELDQAWWLDVANPTWEDMRAIGKLLHLHPLTLEDILQQEPREKLELFPKLGYYFIVFRAMESRKSRPGPLVANPNDINGLTDGGFAAEVNVYLVIFREGILSFHFEDITEHTDLLRSKVLAHVESGTVTMSSDWIAHGIMDSIVDSFFPFLEEIEREIISIENLVFADDATRLQAAASDVSLPPSISNSDTVVSKSSLDHENIFSPPLSEKPDQRNSQRMRFSVPKQRLFSLRRLKQLARRLSLIISQVNFNLHIKQPQTNTTFTAVHRVAHVRRLVTSLSRFLATKSEVVAQVKKRILMTGEHGLGNGTGDDRDVFVYMGDVQDHILTLQQSLAHYERMLSQLHPTYLTHLRLSASKSKAGSDKAILYLTVISMAVLCIQAVIGFESMNIHIPGNARPGPKYTAFCVVLALSLSVLAVFARVVRYWWVKAKRKRNW